MTALETLLADVRGAWSPSLSPDGRQVAFVSDLDGEPRAYVSPSDTWEPKLLSDADETVAAVAWSRTAPEVPGWVFITAQPGSTPRPTMRAVQVDGSAARPIEGPLGGTAFAGCWAPHRPSYAYSAVGPDDAQVVLLDVESGSRQVLAEGGGLLVTDVSAEGRVVLRRGPRGRRHLALIGADGRPHRVTPAGEGNSDEGRFSPDGRTLWFRTDTGRDRGVLARVALDDDGRPGPLEVVAEREDAELEHFALARAGGRVVVAWNAGGVSELECLDPATGARTPIDGLPWGMAGGMSLSMDGSLLAVEVGGPRLPRALVVVDLDRGGVRQLSDIPFPAAVSVGVVPTLAEFAAHDGLPLAGWLYRPDGAEGPVPTVISLHGGPEAQERPGFSPLYQCLAAAGIAVLAPNVRGSSGYGRTFTERDSGMRRRDAIRDVESCATWLLQQGLAAPGALGVQGTSYGGYLVLAAIVEFPNLFAGAVAVCGIADFLTFFATTEPWIAAAARTKYGDPQVDAALLRSLSPLHRLHAARTPTLLVHGEEDTNVPVGEARQAHEALRSGGVTSELLVLPGDGHSLERPESRLANLRATVAWFRRFLG